MSTFGETEWAYSTLGPHGAGEAIVLHKTPEILSNCTTVLQSQILLILLALPDVSSSSVTAEMQGSTTGSVVANVETEAVISDSDIVSLIVTVGNVASLDKSAVSDDVDAEIVQQTRHCTGNENIY